METNTTKDYKSKQGRIVRWGVFLACSLLFLFGSYRLYFTFSWFRWDWAHEAWTSFTIPAVDITVKLTPALAISVGFGLFCLLLFRYLCFRHVRISDFLIDTESEMRKVSWPTLSDVIKSSIAVIAIMVLLSLYLLVVDVVLNEVFKNLFRAS